MAWGLRIGRGRRRADAARAQGAGARRPSLRSRRGQARIVIADSSPILLASVEGMFAEHGEFDVHAVGNLAELQQAVAVQRPDAILVDLELHPRGGVDAVACVSSFCRAPLFLWGLPPTDGQEAAARLAGASGFVRKDVSFAALTSTLRELSGARPPHGGRPELASAAGVERGA